MVLVPNHSNNGINIKYQITDSCCILLSVDVLLFIIYLPAISKAKSSGKNTIISPQ